VVVSAITPTGDGSAGLQVIDVSNPTNCVRVDGIDTTGGASAVAVSGNYAYVADRPTGLQVIEISDPAIAWAWATIAPARLPTRAVSGNYACVADGGAAAGD